ncbi:PepSY-associated TM helix domain-containing protein [Tunicatimonas pelagia]|uniref:PepSY-associated TM helix domain-containing protein n=1 Tax=Tunicatimonas pelagia TaxID=931531 RepID=UPI002665818D|nr:PepSY-associated TM helix domain-containing protein [Tunicatimonas pelagia]WKN43015.1 PepSY-associated TM helix domain-containing protein [Tunicatimonas pelagia]
MTFKKLIGQVHLWLGFLAGLVVVISMTAAAIFVWEEELTDWYYGDYVFVEEQTTRQPMAALFAAARKALPDKEVYGVEVFNEPERAYLFTAFQRNPDAGGWTFWDDYQYWDKVYVNPYTGEVTGTVNMLTNWIELTRRLHQNLLLRYAIGHWIVGVATLIILVMVITGLVLWWPRNRKVLRHRLKIKWNARWRRVNYDIHNVGGFYSYLFITILAATGLVWTFDWWSDGIYRLLGNDPEEIFAKPPELVRFGPTPESAINLAWQDAQQQRSSWQRIYFNLPKSVEKGGISAFVEFDGSSGWQESDQYLYQPETGNIHFRRQHENKLLGEKWRNSNYPIHVGSIYGLSTKILACLTALFCASLPITGFYIWLGRRKKKPKRAPRQGTKAKSIRPVVASSSSSKPKVSHNKVRVQPRSQVTRSKSTAKQSTNDDN